VPGKKITDHQVQKYKQHRLKLTQVAAAAKVGISERSAQRIELSKALPSQREARAWRTRADPPHRAASARKGSSGVTEAELAGPAWDLARVPC
jgi:DNA-binding XRE family transcriptional regulator